jgi:hypothetical protein
MSCLFVDRKARGFHFSLQTREAQDFGDQRIKNDKTRNSKQTKLWSLQIS